MSRTQLELLRAYGIKPVKRRGQNFLLDGNLARAIAQDVLALGDRVLELGAGGGALTAPLLEAARGVTCVEVDRNLCALLQNEFGERSGFQLIEGDLARLDWAATVEAAGPRPVVAGNLPYVLTSAVMFALGELHDRVAGGVFMVQREVADRMVAGPGSRTYGVLSAVLGAVFRVRLVRAVPAAVFWPRPEVASAMVELVPGTPWNADEYRRYVATVKTLFGQRRKKLRSLLRSLLELDESTVEALARETGVDVDMRPEQVDRQGYRRLAAALPGKGPVPTPQPVFPQLP